MSRDGFSWGLVSRWTTLFKACPSPSRLIRSNSRLPSSMVMSLRLSGTMDRSQLMIVVFPEPVLPAIQTDTPYRIQQVRRSSISSVAEPEAVSFSLETVCWLTIRMEALMPTSASTMGVLSTEIRIFLSRKPMTEGMVSSMTMPQVLRSRLVTSMACWGDWNRSGIFMERPPLMITSISS